MSALRASVLLMGSCSVLASCTAFPPPQEWFSPKAKNRVPHVRKRRFPSPGKVRKLTWREALRIARDRSPTVAAAVERIRQSEAAVREAAALAYPRLDARASHVHFFEAADFRGRSGIDVSGESTRTRFFTGRGSDISSAGLDLSYPLFDGGDAYYARNAAGASLEASRHEAGRVLNELELRVSTSFINVLLADGAISIAADSLQFTEDQERQSRAREQVGEGLKVDTLRFATSASEERLVLNQAQAERRIRLAVLSELLGLRLPENVELVRPEAGLEVPDGDLVALAMRERAEIQSNRARISELDNRLARERASWLPSINLFSSYGVISLDDFRLSQAKDEFQVGGALSMNLFEGGATAARMAGLEHRLFELRQRREELLLMIEREVREAEANLEVARKNIEVSRQTVTLAEEVLERVAARYRAGEAQVIDVTEATLQRTRAQLALLRSRVNLLLSQARLRRAAGLGLLREAESPAAKSSMSKEATP